MGINFKKVSEESNTGFDPLPENRYNITVEKAEVTTAATGTEMVKAQFVVTDGDFKGRKLWNNFTLTPKSYVYLYNFLKAAGSKLIDNNDVNEAQVASEMVGMRVSAFVETKNNNMGNPVNTLSRFSEVEKTAGTEAGSSDLFQ